MSFFSVVAAARKRTGGGGTPSYHNPTGTGITVSNAGLLSGQGQTSPQSAIVTNNTFATGLFFRNGVALDGVNFWIQFDFGTATLITEDTFYQQDSTSQGTWKWQGSNDAATWTNIGSSFALVTSATTVHTAMSSNTTSYRYYRIMGVSGTTNWGPWIYQFQFKSYP